MERVHLTPDAFAELGSLNEPILTRVLSLLERLEHWPNVSGAKALSKNLAGHWRLRTGDYRVQFRVEKNRIIVEKIGHRREFYRE